MIDVCSVFHKNCINLPVQLCHNEQKNILTKRLILGAFAQKWRLIPWWGTIWGGSGEWFCSKSLAVLAARGGPIRYWQYCERCFYILFFSPCIKMWITETDGLYVTIGTFKIQVVFLFGFNLSTERIAASCGMCWMHLCRIPKPFPAGLCSVEAC